MDLSAIIVTILLTGGFFGFVAWGALRSRKTERTKSPADLAEIKFSEVRAKNKNYLGK